MIKEHLVSASVTNGAECICNPDVLLGTKYGLWDFQNEVAPRGTLVDLNAAWELFLSKQDFSDVSFTTIEHRQHEVIDGVVYNEGDVTYILKDNEGNPTGAIFTIKANKGPIEHIEWQNGKLYLYYTKQRALTDDDLRNGAPIRYVKDDEGNVEIDQETGQPLIYDYVSIPIAEIFDNDETHSLFPWFADDENTVRLRTSISDDEGGHLGRVAITSDSEIFVAKEPTTYDKVDLVSLQSVSEQLNKDLGITPEYTPVSEHVSPDGLPHNFRVSGSNLSEQLHEGIGDKSSIVSAINEDLERTRINTKLLAGKIVESNLEWQDILEFAEQIRNNAFKNSTIPNILDALNWIQNAEIGPFKEELDSNITKEILDEDENPQRVIVDNITEALNIIFKEVEENRERIGFDKTNKQWIELTTDNKDTLTEAINEVDEHTDVLSEIIAVKEEWDPIHKKTYYSNPNLSNTLKGRLRLGQVKKDDITIVEAINELQSEIGNLSSEKSGISSIELSTDNKETLVQAINEVDTHSDNNFNTIGAEYTTDLNGKKNSEIRNLNTNNKSSIVNAINELDERVGETSDLNTDNKSNIVNAINEVITKQPLIYQDSSDSESGVIVKNKNNFAGQNSLLSGKNNSVTNNSFASGQENESQGDYTFINGFKNTSKKKFNNVSGKTNFNDGNYNLVNGLQNSVTGDNNIVSGSNNQVITNNSVILGDNIYTKNSNNIIAEGDSLTFQDNISDAIALGKSSRINGSDSITIGESNIVSEQSTTIGNNNETEGPGNVAIGDNNYIGCTDSYTFGNGNRTEGNHSYTVGESNIIIGDNNYVIGENQNVEGDNNVVINASNKVEANNSIVIGDIQQIHDNATHIGGDIYVSTHDTESKLQNLILVDLNDWCKLNNAASLNGEKFLDTQHLVNAIKEYKFRNYSDRALLRFTMQDNNENGYVIIQGKSTRIYLNGTWYFSDNIENGWSRKEGEYLKIIKKTITDSNGNVKDKYYLTLMDQLSTEAIVDTVGAQRSNTEDFKNIDLTHAYGALDIDDVETALNLKAKFNTKVDKYAKIITKYQDDDGVITDKSQNWIDTNDQSRSSDIILSLKESFGFDKFDYQNKSEKGKAGGYVPLGSDGKINTDYLPSYVDDVVDVWAEYTVLSNHDLADIHLYKIINDVDQDGQEIVRKGEPILSGERSKIYVESQPKPSNQASYQFRYTGSKFVVLGSHIVIGEIEGTAFDGGRGRILEESFVDHKNSGTTSIPVLDEYGIQKRDSEGNLMWVTYKPNPHNVTSEQINVIVNDPNDPENVNLNEEYPVEYTIGGAIKEIFNRINISEDKQGSVFNILGNPEDYSKLDALDDIEGNDAPTLISLALNNKERLDDIQLLSNSDIDDLVDTHFILTGE